MSRLASPSLARAAAWGLAVALSVAAWPPIGCWPLSFVALAPLAAALDGLRPGRAFAIAWAHMTVTAVIVFRFLLHGLVEEYAVALVPSLVFIVVLLAILAFSTSLAAATWAALSRSLSDFWAPLAFASLWVAGEWLRAAGLGVPWMLIAHSLGRAPFWLQTAELGSVWLPGFVLAATSAGLGLAVVRRSPRSLAAPAVLLLATAGYGALRGPAVEPGDATRAFRVAVIQASVPQADRFQPGSAMRNTLEHAALTRAVMAEAAPEIVIWSETAVDDDLDLRAGLRPLLEGLAREIGVPLVTGAPRTRAGGPENAVVLFTPDGRLAESYAKQRLVPIAEGEAVWVRPLQGLIPEVAEGDPYVAGGEATVFRDGPAPFSAPICFEVTYPDLMRGFQAAGAEWIVNLSNDAWFGPGGYPEMHLAHAVLRAVELRTWIVRGANTGISAVIDPRGRIVDEIAAFEDGSLVAEVRPTRTRSFHARFGDAPALALVAGLLGAALATRRRR